MIDQSLNDITVDGFAHGNSYASRQIYSIILRELNYQRAS